MSEKYVDKIFGAFLEWFNPIYGSDRCFKSKEYLLPCFNAWSEQQREIEKLKADLQRENKSHNYHCKESQRKNDVIDKLEAKNKWLMNALIIISTANECSCGTIAKDTIKRVEEIDNA